MNCEKIKELILTDYSDNELDKPLRTFVDEHLKVCRPCRDFQTALRKTAIEPFRKISDVKPPEFIWHRIKEAIAKDAPQDAGFLSNLVRRIQEAFFLPSPALVYASVTILLLGAVAFRMFSTQNARIARDYLQEQSEVLAYFDSNGNGANKDFDGLGLESDAENYFL